METSASPVTSQSAQHPQAQQATAHDQPAEGVLPISYNYQDTQSSHAQVAQHHHQYSPQGQTTVVQQQQAGQPVVNTPHDQQVSQSYQLPETQNLQHSQQQLQYVPDHSVPQHSSTQLVDHNSQQPSETQRKPLTAPVQEACQVSAGVNSIPQQYQPQGLQNSHQEEQHSYNNQIQCSKPSQHVEAHKDHPSYQQSGEGQTYSTQQYQPQPTQGHGSQGDQSTQHVHHGQILTTQNHNHDATGSPTIQGQMAGLTLHNVGPVPVPGSGIHCSHCKNEIPINVSVYTCLICSTAQTSTTFCVWCFTSDQTSASHPHDKSYYVTDSDLYVQPQQNASVPVDSWMIRMNVAGRSWYTHKATGFRTHIKPTTAATSGLPTGWVETKTAEGQTFYYDTNTGTSTWTRPVDTVLPVGWKEVRTPDAVPFYVHEELGLSAWERPGEQPVSGAALTPVAAGGVAQGVAGGGGGGSGTTTATGAAAVGGSVKTGGTTTSTTKSGSMSFSEAADLSAQGILSATKAASKFTSNSFKKMTTGYKAAGKAGQ